MKNKTPPPKAPALERGLNVLELLAEEGQELGLKAISQELDIPVPSLWRILGVLREKGYLLFDPDRKTYRLGFKFLYLGNIVLSRMGFRSQARSHLKELMEQTGETAELSARVKDQLILIEQVEGPNAVRLFSRVGSAYPYFHATAPGKVYLAHMETGKRARVMARMGLPAITAHTITNLEELEKDLNLVAENGFATDVDEMRAGVCRVASPVYGRKGAVVACMGIAAPSFRMHAEDLDRIGHLVRDSAQKLSLDIQDQDQVDWQAFDAF